MSGTSGTAGWTLGRLYESAATLVSEAFISLLIAPFVFGDKPPLVAPSFPASLHPRPDKCPFILERRNEARCKFPSCVPIAPCSGRREILLVGRETCASGAGTIVENCDSRRQNRAMDSFCAIFGRLQANLHGDRFVSAPFLFFMG